MNKTEHPIDNRPLNSLELACRKLDLTSPFNIVVSAELKGSANPQTVAEGLELLRRRHSYLTYRIDEDDQGVKFIYDNNRVLLKVIEFADNSAWESVWENEANTAFNVSRAPLVRATLIQYPDRFYLIITMSHIISDGISALMFLIDLLVAIDSLTSGMPLKGLDLLPPIYPDMSLFPALAAEYMGPASVHATHEYAKNVIRSYIPIEKRKSSFIKIRFNQEQTMKMLARCRSYQVSMNTYLASAMLTVFRDYAISKKLSMPIFTKCSSGVNLRRYYRGNIPNEQLGMWSGFGYVYNDLSIKSSLWNIAQQYEIELQGYIQRLLPFVHLLKSAQRFSGASKKHPPFAVESRLPYLLLTNLGRAPIYQQIQTHELLGIDFATPMHRNWVNDMGFGLCAVTYHDCIRATFVYPNPAMPKNTAMQLAASLEVVLAG
jgi:hypothetical protein